MPVVALPGLSVSPRRAWGPILVAGGVWLLVGLSASYWGWRAWGTRPTVAVPVTDFGPVTVDVQAVARALGAPDATQPVAESAAPVLSRYTLLGVVRDAQGQGVALISSDGQRAKPYRVGGHLPDGWVLRSLSPREAVLGQGEGGAVLRLTLSATKSAG